MRPTLSDLPTDTEAATVLFAATRTSAEAADAADAQWRTLAAALTEQGASPELLEILEPRVQQPTGVAGEHGRLVVVTAQGVQLDRLLSTAPATDSALLARGPDMLAVARYVSDVVHALLVEVDRTGADLCTLDSSRVADDDDARTIDAAHNELTKNRLGGLSHRRIHARAEDSWERNAEQIAHEIESAVAADQPELVLLAGDVRMVALIRESLTEPTGQLVHVLESGSRADGVHDEAYTEELTGALDQWRMRRSEQVLNRYHEAAGRDQAAVSGIDDVLDVLRRGQAEDILLTEEAVGPDSAVRTRTLWMGPEPVQAGSTADEVKALGVDQPLQAPAHVVLGRLMAATDAGVTVVDEAALDVPEGVAALLRWHDESTPAQSVYSLSRDT